MYNGAYNLGIVKKTENQQKKHQLQMTDQEIKYLKALIKKINPNSLKYTYHLYKKTQMQPEKFMSIIKSIISSDIESEIIEFNITPQENGNDYRVLLRSKKIEFVNMKNTLTGEITQEKCNLCIVLSLKTNKVVTMYWNKKNDNHIKTMNWERYNKEINIIQTMNT